MNRVVLVSGTWGAKWAQDGTPFRQMLTRNGVDVVLPPFEWSEDVSGIPSFFTGGKHSDWKAGGFALGLFAARLPYEDRIFIAHSYGGNCVAYGLISKLGVPIRRLITIGTPYREDMEDVWRDARQNVGFHVHICDPKPPMIERFAQVFDGRFSLHAQTGHPTADLVVKIPKMKHSKVLDDPAFIRRWEMDENLVFLLKAERLLGERNAAVV